MPAFSTWLRAAALACALTAPALAQPNDAPAAATAAKPVSFEVLDRGDAVEVIARNVKAARTAIFPVRSRLEIPIVGAPAAKRALPTDRTVKVVEFETENAMRVLSVKLGFERPDVKTLSRFAQAIQVGDDLHLIVPRKVPAEGTSPKLPEPTFSPAMAAVVAKAEAKLAAKPEPAKLDAAKIESAKLEAAKPDAAKPEAAKLDAAKIEAKAEPAKAEAKPILGPAAPPPAAEVKPVEAAKPEAAKPEDKLEAKHDADAKHDAKTDAKVGAGEAKPSAKTEARTKLSQTLAPSNDDSLSKIMMLAALGLAAAGAGVWWMRRRRVPNLPAQSIDILAQRSLGGKARLVLVSAGPNEMLVSVTPQQVNVLGQWRKTGAFAAIDPASLDDLVGQNAGYATEAPVDEIYDHRSGPTLSLPPALKKAASRMQADRMPIGGRGRMVEDEDDAAPIDAPAPRVKRAATSTASPTPVPVAPAPAPAPAPPRTAAASAAPMPSTESALSPAVSGILRLRRTSNMEAATPTAAGSTASPLPRADDEDAEVEADARWVKEILAATGARR